MSAAPAFGVGVAAVDASTGDVAHDEFEDGAMRPELEARLLRVAPAEVLLVEPVYTERLASSPPQCPAAAKTDAGGVRVGRVAAGSGYVDGGAAAAVAAAVVEREAERARNRGAGETETETTRSRSLSLDLPARSGRAVATALDWLRQFGLDGMIRLAPAFRRMSECGEMRLTPNVLRQLERAAIGGGRAPRLAPVVDGSNARAPPRAKRRLLRRWIAHPLTGRAAIEARLEAVAELRDEGGGGRRWRARGIVPRVARVAGGASADAKGTAVVFHGTATPAELVAALAAVRDFAASVNGMRRGAVFGAKLENTSSTPMTQTCVVLVLSPGHGASRTFGGSRGPRRLRGVPR